MAEWDTCIYLCDRTYAATSPSTHNNKRKSHLLQLPLRPPRLRQRIFHLLRAGRLDPLGAGGLHRRLLLEEGEPLLQLGDDAVVPG